MGQKDSLLISLVLNINRDHCLIAFFSFTKHQYCKLKLALFHLYPNHMRFFVDVNHLRFPIHAITIKRLLCKIEPNFAGVVVLQFWMWLLKVQMGSSTLHSGSLPGQRTIRNLQSSSLCFVKSWWESVFLQPWFVHMCSMLSISIFAVKLKSHGGSAIICWLRDKVAHREAIGPFVEMHRHMEHLTIAINPVTNQLILIWNSCVKPP